MGITIEIQFIKGGVRFASPVTLNLSNSTSRNGLHHYDFEGIFNSHSKFYG